MTLCLRSRRSRPGATLRNCRLSATLVLGLLAPSLATAVTFTNLHSFLVTPYGSQPLAPLALGSDGNLYGTASAGGPNVGQGTVFKITTNGLPTLLHSFTGAADGSDAESALIQWTDGSFYGTTRGGGVFSNGTAFKITTNGILTTLVQFTGGDDGSTPVGGLALGQDGNFYGATEYGGTHGFGTVFRLAPSGQLTTLFAFNDINGSFPLAPLVLGRDGNFYGTTSGGGTYSGGTVFQIATNGALAKVVALGATSSDPQNPEGPLVQGADGTFYGTAYDGGSNGQGCVFKITSSGALTNLYSFGTFSDSNGNPMDGSHPAGGLVFGSDRNLYGTTESGGTNDPSSGGDGTIFRITPAGALTTLYSFSNGLDGAAPDAGLLVVGANLYGTASRGGGDGTIFKIGMNGAFTFVYDLSGLDGLNPSAELAMDHAGNLYGTTEFGGLVGLGTVFKYQPNGVYTVLTNFDSSQGSVPDGRLLLLADGSFLGTAFEGGLHSRGTVFNVTTNGVLTTVYNFGSITNSNGLPLDGDQPWSGLILAPDGNYYGTTYGGGQGSSGVVFGVTSNGTLTNLIPFDNPNDGNPRGANLALGPDGNLYGTTSLSYGSVFRITPGGLNTLYFFQGLSDGLGPQGGLALGLDGCFYGTTSSRGDYNHGTIFRITTNGLLTTLYSFDGTNGGAPHGTLLLSGDGSFYGTTMVGGSSNNGVIFQFRTDGTYTNLHSFMGLADGANPDCGLTLGLDGNLYGVAEFGGAGGNGTLFELILRDPAPVLLSVEPASNTVMLSWSAVAGRIYQLQFTDDLRQNFWIDLGLPVVATNSIVVATDPSPRAACRFYRVVMLP
jgi:uncharacterized repeat protein (TIGR03803 family)